MVSNVGQIDRIVRGGVAFGLFGLGLFFQSWWGALGVLPLVTALNASCPVYRLLGLDTRSQTPREGVR